MGTLLAAMTLPELIGMLTGAAGLIGSGIQAFKKHPNHGAAFDQFTNPSANFTRFAPQIGSQNKLNMANAGRIAAASGVSPFIAGQQAATMNRQSMNDAYMNYMPQANDLAFRATEAKANADFQRFEADQRSKMSFFNDLTNIGIGTAFDDRSDSAKTLGQWRDMIKYPSMVSQQESYKNPYVNMGGIQVDRFPVAPQQSYAAPARNFNFWGMDNYQDYGAKGKYNYRVNNNNIWK